jgi:hypothetical protein
VSDTEATYTCEPHGRVKKLIEDRPTPPTSICDHDREDRLTFERLTEQSTQDAYKAVSVGIQREGWIHVPKAGLTWMRLVSAS